MFHCSSRFVALLRGGTLCARVRRSDFLKQWQPLIKISFSFRFIWSIESAKRTYAVVVGYEHTPVDGQRWMRDYQQVSEDALKKAI